MVHSCEIPPLSHFHCALGFATQILAYLLDSLVRVSRRVAEDHFVNIFDIGVKASPPIDYGPQSKIAQQAALKGKSLLCQNMSHHLSQFAGICYKL